MYMPSIGTTGVFQFKDPFNHSGLEGRTLKVESVRSLEEIYKDKADPLNNIYIKNKLTESDYKNDKDNNVPIVVLSNEGGKLFYVPANRIVGAPLTSGAIYKRRVINVNLGFLPEEFNIDPVKTAIDELIRDYTGIKGIVAVVPASESILKTDNDHKQFMANLATTSYARGKKSLITQLQEARDKLDNLNQNYQMLQKFMMKTWNNNVTKMDRPNNKDLEIYTKKIRIDVVSPVGLSYRAMLGGIVFYRSNAFNLDPTPIYAVGLVKAIEEKLTYTGLLDKNKMKVVLDSGFIKDDNLTNMFSDHYKVSFDTDMKTNISRASVVITLNERTNIRNFDMKFAHSSLHTCSRARVVFYNENDVMIYNTTFQKDRDFEVENNIGIGQIVKARNIRLNTAIAQGKLPELVSIH